MSTNFWSSQIKEKYKTTLSRLPAPCCFVFRKGYPFVSYIVPSFHCKPGELNFSLACLCCLLLVVAGLGSMSIRVSGCIRSCTISNGRQRYTVMSFSQPGSSQDVGVLTPLIPIHFVPCQCPAVARDSEFPIFPFPPRPLTILI